MFDERSPEPATMLLLIIVYLSFISLGLPDSLLGSAWPAMYKGLSVPLHYAGILSMIVAGGTVVSSLLSGKTVRRFGTGMVTLGSVLMTAAALIGFSLSRSFAILCLWSIPLGLGAGSVDAALNNYVALHHKAKHMNWLHCFWGIGASIGPVIMSTYLANGETWRFGFRTVGIIQFCLVAVLFLSLPLWSKNTTHEQEAQEEKRKPITYRALLGLPGLKQMLVVFFCYCTIEATAGLWGSSYLVTFRNIPPENAARWIALYYFGITAGRLISGFMSNRLDNRRMVRLGQSLIACGIVMLLLPFDGVLLPGFFMIGLGCAPIYPSLLHETPRNFGKEYSQAVMGLQMASAYIGTTLMPPLFGWLATHFSFAIFPICIGLVLIIKILMAETVNRKAIPQNS